MPGPFGETACPCDGAGHPSNAQCATCGRRWGQHHNHACTGWAGRESGEDTFRPVAGSEDEPEGPPECYECGCECTLCHDTDRCSETRCRECECGFRDCSRCGCHCEDCPCEDAYCGECECGDSGDEDEDGYERATRCTCEHCVAGEQYATDLARGVIA